MRPLRFAILGFGHHARKRLMPAFKRSQQVELAGLWRRNPQASADDAAEFGVRAFASAEELCASPDVDAVFITSPDALHLADVQLCCAHGKAILCEKPLAMNTGQALAMVEAAEQAQVFFGVGQHFRFNQSVDFLRAQIAAGRIGVPQLAYAQFCYPAQDSPRTWITDPTLATGGPIGDVGVHCIDALRYVLGAEVQSVATLAAKDALSGEVEAYASLQMRCTGGVPANVVVSARAAYRTYLEVIGSEGALVSENGLNVEFPVEVQLRRGGKLVESQTFLNDDAYVRMLDAFAEAVRRPDEAATLFTPTGMDGMRNQRILDAAYRAWHSGLREPV